MSSVAIIEEYLKSCTFMMCRVTYLGIMYQGYLSILGRVMKYMHLFHPSQMQNIMAQMLP